MFCHVGSCTFFIICACKSFTVWSCPADWALFIECTYSWSNKDWEALKSAIGRFAMDIGDRGTRFAVYTLNGDFREITSIKLHYELKNTMDSFLQITREASNETNVLGALKHFRESVLFRMQAGKRVFFLVTVGPPSLNVSQIAAEKRRIDGLQIKGVRVLRFLLHFQPYKVYLSAEMIEALRNVGVDGLFKVDGLPHQNMFKVFSHISSQISFICRVDTALPLKVCSHFNENGNLVNVGSDFCTESSPELEAGALKDGGVSRTWQLDTIPSMVGLTLPHRPEALFRIEKSKILSQGSTVAPTSETRIHPWSVPKAKRSYETCECLLYIPTTSNLYVLVPVFSLPLLLPGQSACLKKNDTVVYQCSGDKLISTTKTKSATRRCDEELTGSCEDITCAVREVANQVRNARIGSTSALDTDKSTVFVGMELKVFCEKGWVTAETRSRMFGVLCIKSGWKKDEIQSCSSLVRNCVVRIPHSLNYVITDLADGQGVMDDSRLIVPVDREWNFKCMDTEDTTFIVRRNVKNTFSAQCSTLGELEIPPMCKEVCGFMMEKYPHFVAVDDDGHHLEPDGPNWVILHSGVSVTCESNAHWTHTKSKTIVLKCDIAWKELKTPPPCIAVTCLVRLPEYPHFKVFTNGELVPLASGNHTSTLELPLSSTVEWRCDHGYSWKADAVNLTTECDKYGNIMPVVPPSCTVRRCHAPAMKHATSDPPTPAYILFGDNVNYTCLDGYGLSREKYTFSHRCEGKDIVLPTDRCAIRSNCTITVSPDNQTITYQERGMAPTSIRPNVVNGLWTVVTIECREPFEHFDRSMTKHYQCVSDNTWRPHMLGCYARDYWLELLRSQVETEDQLTNILIGIIPGIIVIAILAFLWLFLEKRRKLKKDLDMDDDLRAKAKQQGFINQLFGGKIEGGSQRQEGSQYQLGSQSSNAAIRNESIMPGSGSGDSALVGALADEQSPERNEGGSDHLGRRMSDISDLVESSDDSEEATSRRRMKDNDVDSLGSDKYKVFGGDKKRGTKPQGQRMYDDSPSPIQSPLLRLSSSND